MKRGGKRPGSGRKPGPQTRMLSVQIDKQLLDSVKAIGRELGYGGLRRTVEQALHEYIRKPSEHVSPFLETQMEVVEP